MLELAILVPVVLMLALAGLEAASAYRYSELSVSLSREMANYSFRECAADRQSFAVERFNPNRCLSEQVLPIFSSRLAKVLPRAEFIVQVYSYDPGSGDLLNATASNRSQESTFFSRYERQGVSTMLANPSEGELGQVLRDFGTVVIAEIHVPHAGFWALLPRWLGGRYQQLYAVTIV
jgi:hypothetical protein